jgi:hypothetical protein
MKLKPVVDNLDDVNSAFHELYTERGGKYEFTGVEGMKTQADVERVQTALAKERADHKTVKDQLASITAGRKPEEVVALLDKLPELEAAAAGKVDDEKLNGIVEVRIKSRLAPLERELGQVKTTLAEKDQIIDGFTKKDKTRMIHDAVRLAATGAKILPEALEDAILLADRIFEVDDAGKVVAKDNVGVTPGIDPSVWFTDLQPKRPHWWGASFGGGAGGNRQGQSGAVNPWTHEHWNMTEQGKIYSASADRANQLAKQAGTTVGGQKPAPRK